MVSITNKIKTKVARKMQIRGASDNLIEFADFMPDIKKWGWYTKQQTYNDYLAQRIAEGVTQQEKYWNEVVSELPRQDRIEAKLDRILRKM